VTRALLVAREVQAEVRVVEQCIEERDERAAGDSEDGIHAIALQDLEGRVDSSHQLLTSRRTAASNHSGGGTLADLPRFTGHAEKLTEDARDG
jgi:hypothetical protein